MPETNSRLLVEAELRALSRELDAALEPLDLSSAVTRRLRASPASMRPRERVRRRRLVAVLVATVAGSIAPGVASAMPSARRRAFAWSSCSLPGPSRSAISPAAAMMPACRQAPP